MERFSSPPCPTVLTVETMRSNEGERGDRNREKPIKMSELVKIRAINGIIAPAQSTN